MLQMTWERPWLYPKQERAIFNRSRWSLIEASTKAGKTHGCLAWLIERAMAGRRGQNFWWVAPIGLQAEMALGRLKAQLSRSIYTTNESDHWALLHPVGTKIWFKSADKPNSLYGEDVWAAVLDEASRMKEESWEAVRSTLSATRGPARIIGNVHGRKNWFYRLCRKAQAGEPGMSYHKIIAHDAIEAGVLQEEEIEDARRTMRPEIFRELYFAEPSDDQGNPFGVENIKACTKPGLSKHPPLCWGWDLAKSADWTVGIGLDYRGSVSRFERWRKPWGETIAAIRRCSLNLPTLLDSTGVGDPIVEGLARSSGNFEGYLFTPSSKQKLMEGLAVDIQSGKVGFPPGAIPAELEAFEYEVRETGSVRYSAPGGQHDDCVMALALARQKQRTMVSGRIITSTLHGLV